ncbi:DNA cytosine methyltransferase [Pseudomonas sp. HLS-6 TE3448]
MSAFQKKPAFDFKTQYGLGLNPQDDEIVVDFFCGGGGAGTGLEMGLGRPVTVAKNHNPAAISMHTTNHPHARHYTTDVFEGDPDEECAGRRVGWFHMSPDCTHHSQAAGGQPRKREIRNLSWIGLKWAGKKMSRVISLENVKQIMKWGPLIAKRDKTTGRVMKLDGGIAALGERVPAQQQFLVPDPKRRGITWRRFVTLLEGMGYVVECRIIKACDFGTPTSRERLFMIARCDGQPIAWPEPTHTSKPGKGQQSTQKDNLSELRQLRPVFDSAPIDALTPAMIAQYRDARSAKVRANREIATLSHVFNMAREWGLTAKENPCQGVRKNKETPRDYYANDAVWDAVYKKAVPELKDAMDLAYLTGQRPADVLVMRRDDIEGGYLVVQQNKTHKKLRIMLSVDGVDNSLGKLIKQMAARNQEHSSSYLIVIERGKRMSAPMLRNRWDEARALARSTALEESNSLLSSRIAQFQFQFQFRDIRPKAASEIKDIEDASLLLGHTKGDITERVYRRVRAIAKPSK